MMFSALAVSLVAIAPIETTKSSTEVASPITCAEGVETLAAAMKAVSTSQTLEERGQLDEAEIVLRSGLKCHGQDFERDPAAAELLRDQLFNLLIERAKYEEARRLAEAWQKLTLDLARQEKISWKAVRSAGARLGVAHFMKGGFQQAFREFPSILGVYRFDDPRYHYFELFRKFTNSRVRDGQGANWEVKAFANRVEKFSGDHFTLRKGYFKYSIKLIHLLHDIEDYHNAIRLSDILLSQYAQGSFPLDVQYFQIVAEKAGALAALSRFEEARALFDQANLNLAKLLPPNSPARARTALLEGKTYLLQGNTFAAEESLLQSYRLVSVIYGPTHPRAGTPLSIIAQIHLARRNLDDANTYLEAAEKAFAIRPIGPIAGYDDFLFTDLVAGFLLSDYDRVQRSSYEYRKNRGHNNSELKRAKFVGTLNWIASIELGTSAWLNSENLAKSEFRKYRSLYGYETDPLTRWWALLLEWAGDRWEKRKTEDYRLFFATRVNTYRIYDEAFRLLQDIERPGSTDRLRLSLKMSKLLAQIDYDRVGPLPYNLAKQLVDGGVDAINFTDSYDEDDLERTTLSRPVFRAAVRNFYAMSSVGRD
ncbi:MAG: tetratricopeptide repeat protein [Sphingomonadaceae bacterium]